MATINIVKIAGKYAIQKKSFFSKTYLDLMSPSFWWPRDDYFFKDCLSTDLEKVRKMKEIHVDGDGLVIE